MEMWLLDEADIFYQPTVITTQSMIRYKKYFFYKWQNHDFTSDTFADYDGTFIMKKTI